MISVIIPSYHEDESVVQQCVDSIETAMLYCPDDVEIYVAKDIKGIGKARNYGASQTTGDILVFIDADCTMSCNFLREVHFKAEEWENVGGGTKRVKFDQYSIGRILAVIPLVLWLYWHQVTGGAVWVRRVIFDAMHGYIEDNDPDLDYDFLLRLKKEAKKNGRKFRSLKNCYMVWSTRGFIRYGQWFWLKKYRIFKEN